MSLGVGLVLILGLVVFWFAMTFNRFIFLRNMVKQAWSDVDVQLKRRHDLLPKLVTVVEGYAAHEQETLTRVTETRGQCRDAGQGREREQAEMALGTAIRGLFALAESYPDLKADGAFLNLQREITDVEDDIQMARRYYNGSVRLYNVQLESFPSLIVGKIMRYRIMDYFQAEDEDREVDIRLGQGEQA